MTAVVGTMAGAAPASADGPGRVVASAAPTVEEQRLDRAGAPV
ncbi:hypothetical protein [Streptomyces sp. NPDC059015]